MKTHKHYNAFLQDFVVGMTQAGLLVGASLVAALLTLTWVAGLK